MPVLSHPIVTLKPGGPDEEPEPMEYYTKHLSKDRKTGSKCVLKTIDGTTMFDKIGSYQTSISASVEIKRSTPRYKCPLGYRLEPSIFCRFDSFFRKLLMTSGDQDTIEFKDGPYLKVAKKKPIFIGSLDIQLINDYVGKLKDLPTLQKAPEKKDRGYSILRI